jgi:hypothetical protein
MRPRMTALSWLLFIVLAGPAIAQTELWAQMTARDLAAAKELISSNHPAAVPGIDPEFQSALKDGYSSALQLAEQVRSYEGYRAVLQRYSAGFGDRHISTGAVLQSPQRWPGFMVALGEDWRVTSSVDEDAPKPGSQLISCDGVVPLVLAESRLRPTMSNWNIAAQRKRNSWRLLVDDGDPFVTVPKQCTFADESGNRFEHTLHWRTIPPSDLNTQMRVAVGRAKPDVSLSAFADGWWIRLGTLVDDARPVVEEVARRSAELHAGRFVVVDVRGNGGGSSIYSERIAETLYGEQRTASVLKRIATGPEATTWRASPGNLETLDQYVERFARELGPDDRLVHELKKARAAVSEAMREGAATATVPIEVEGKKKQTKVRGPTPVVVLLTDRFCFSSCLMATHLFRGLGALHVGEETDQNTHYTEVRSITLPSALSTFSTMQAIDQSHALRIGPFTPTIVYSGRTDDDAAVKTWVSDHVLNRLAEPPPQAGRAATRN